MASGYALGEATDITIFDDSIAYGARPHDPWWAGDDAREGIHEDQEVEPDSHGTQKYDLESVFLEGRQLGMVGGFNFATGYEGYDSGDIFIARQKPIYGDAAAGTGSGTMPNIFGYNYAIRLNFDSNQYTVYEIGSDSILSLATRPEMDIANPVRYVSGGQAIDEGAFLYESNLTDAETGFNRRRWSPYLALSN